MRKKNNKLIEDLRWFAEMRRIEALSAVRMLADKARDLERGENVEYWKATNTDWCERSVTDELTVLRPVRAAN